MVSSLPDLGIYVMAVTSVLCIPVQKGSAVVRMSLLWV